MIFLKFFKRFNRKAASFFAAFLVLFIYLLTVPISAMTITDSSFNVFEAAPVPITVIKRYGTNASFIDPYTISSTVCPVLSVNAVEHDGSNGIYRTTDTSVNNDASGSAIYRIYLNDQNLDITGGNLIGEASYRVSFSTFFIQNITYDIEQLKIKANDFWVWDYDFSDSRLDTQSTNLQYSGLPLEAIEFGTVYYDILYVDSSGSSHLFLDNQLSYNQNITNSLTTQFFIDNDELLNSVYDGGSVFVHIDFWELTFIYSYTSNPDFSVNYVCNPYLNDIDTLVTIIDGGGSPESPYNPAFGFIPYTDWIGTAVSGFLDTQIFPGFTLGGVFITVFSFGCVMWFLKLVAGG